MIKRFILATALLCSVAVLPGCNDADIASKNISTAADNFEITRRIVFYNGITGEYMLTMEGLCSLGNQDKARELSVTCKIGPHQFKKSFLGLSDNVSYIVEQIDPADVSDYHYRVVFKPQTILPDIDFKGDASELTRNRN